MEASGKAGSQERATLPGVGNAQANANESSRSNVKGLSDPSASLPKHSALSHQHSYSTSPQPSSGPSHTDGRNSPSFASARLRFEKLVRRYYYQLTTGCGDPNCDHKLCASCKSSPKLSPDASAIMAVQLASRKRHVFCPRIPQDPPVALANHVLNSSAGGSAISSGSVSRSSSPAVAVVGSVVGASASPRVARSRARTASGDVPDRIHRAAAFGSTSGTSTPVGNVSSSPSGSAISSPAPSKPFLYSLLSSSSFSGLFQDEAGDEISNESNAPAQSKDTEVVTDSSMGFLGINFLSKLASSAFNSNPSTPPRTIEQDKSEKEGMPPRARSLMDIPSLLSASLSVNRMPTSAASSAIPSPARVLSPSVSVAKIGEPVIESLTYELISESVSRASKRFEVYAEDGSVAHAGSSSEEEGRNSSRGVDSELVEMLKDAFSSSEVLNRSFLAAPGAENPHPSGVDINAAQESYKLILALQPRDVYETALSNAIELMLAKLALNLRALQNSAPTNLRQILILLECPLFFDTRHHESLCRKLCILMGGLTSRPRTALIDFFVKHKEQDFINLVRLFHTYIDTHFVTSGITTVGGTTQGSSASVPIGRPDEALLGAVKALGLLYQANLRAAGRVPISQFYSETLSRRLNFKEEYKIWKRSFADSSEGSSIGISKHVNSEQSQADISFFDFPFLFEPVAKTRILHIDAMVQMSAEYEEAFVHQALVIHAARFLYDSPSVTQLGESLKTALNPYLVLSVRRHRLVDDVLDQLSRATTRELKKPLKVRFVGGGEDGVDQGGVQKEFFQVIINQLLDPAYGLFVVDDETRYVWINGASLEGEAIFECVGMVVGLALYNGVILGVDFPRIVYKKLLDEEIDLDDIKQAFPSLGRGLQQLLDWSDGDVSDIFMRTFEISYDVYGKVKTFPLVEGGEDILVTNEKRGEYVRLYIQHLCGESVKWQFEAFKRGFLKVCGGRAIKMCRPEELELLVCGTTTSVVDFTALETGAQYDDGYSPSHPVIRNFWSIVHTDFSLEQKRKLLSFVTASDRVPLRGLEGLTFVIQRNGPDTERLPTSLTCFGRLLLPEYSTREKLKERLVTAIENAKGFGLV